MGTHRGSRGFERGFQFFQKVYAPPLTALSLNALIAVFAGYLFVIVASQKLLPDLAIYVHASEAFKAGKNIYSEPYQIELPDGKLARLPYLYPPLLAHLLSKGVDLEYPTIKFIWCLISFLAIVGSVVNLTKLLAHSWWRDVSHRTRLLIVTFFTLCFEPLSAGVGYGQVTALILFLLSAFMLASVRRHEFVAGLALALAIHIKITPIVLLVAPLLFHRWRIVLWSLVNMLALTLVTVVDTGSTDVFVDFLRGIPLAADYPGLRENVFNLSVVLNLAQVLGLPAVKVSQLLIRIVLLLGILGGTLSMRRRDEQDYLAMVGFLIVGMMLISPIMWFHHLAWLLLPITVASMRPTSTTNERLAILTTALGILFGLDKVLLLHITMMKQAPGLVHFSALLPGILLMWLGFTLWNGWCLSPVQDNPCARLFTSVIISNDTKKRADTQLP